MAIDIKSMLTNKWTLAAAGAGGGYVVGKKYIKKKRADVYGALGGALAGYVLGRVLEPKQPAQLTDAEYAAAARQVTEQPKTQMQGSFDEYVDMEDDPVTELPPGASVYAHKAAKVQRDAQAAMRQPPRHDVANTEDLSEGWNGAGGSLGGGLGDSTSDDEIDELIAQAQRSRN